MPETATPAAVAGVPAARAPLGFMLLLVGLTALAPFSLQIFMPALPVIQADFRVTPGVAQLVLSLSVLASAFAMLAYGPLSDRFGRRPALLAGLLAFVAGSVLCALAPSVETLIGGRVVQAVGAAAGMVLARAIVRDLHDRERSASVIAYLTTAMVVAPMLAPTVGALLIDVASWRTIFALSGVVGLAVLWQTARRLVETRGRGAQCPGRRDERRSAARRQRLGPRRLPADVHRRAGQPGGGRPAERHALSDDRLHDRLRAALARRLPPAATVS
jgi:multidrug resistance protein